ncbi:uncharacterized protein Z518_04000 [Rhinocladiella mackenziei CBS 650.93]|uniref:Uncharacterized protein n=1 Tax=Rhinocladiella mackenziei CBS 650.93 TaxID=1442369 RepID=A0A0D2ISE5_9EURO|nr:uncharacterized protein Z518_04000 [Rhinocladiella mackenziei CBS 650.93]KIX06026.1 hypothetical protein Z518_04000 [Rhinocladiella mackenziei CBS 650.93]
MTRSITAASCISYQNPRFVWISDKLLADAFRRFCHPKRYGSSVPGPLEAQRRAAKRKNTSLAPSLPGGIPVDPSVVFGCSSKIDWWQSRAQLDDKPALSGLLPSWLFPYSHPSARHSQPPSSETSDTEIIPQPSRPLRLQQLAQCQTLQDIREWLQNQGIFLHNNQSIGAAIQKHMLKANLSATEIATYLCDPHFHPPGTSFIRQMSPELLDRVWDGRSWKAVRESICKAAELGLISISDLQAIITHAADTTVVKLRKDDGELVHSALREKENLISGILTSLDRSKVLSKADLGPTFLSELLSNFASLTHMRRRHRIVWHLLPWARENDAPAVSQLIVRDLGGICREDPQQPVGHKLAESLVRVPTRVLRLALLQTTERLIAIAREEPTHRYRYLFYHWIGTLAAFRSTRKNILLMENDWVIQQSYQSNLQRDQRLLAFAWTSMCLCRDRRGLQRISDRLKFLDEFEKSIKSIPDFAAKGFLDNAVVSLQSLPLPHKDALLKRLTRCIDHEIQPLIDGKFSVLGDDEYYRKAQDKYVDELLSLSESLNHNLSLFKSLTRRMIHKNLKSFDIVCRILENNMSLKLALSQSFPQRRNAQQERTQSPDRVAFSSLDPPCEMEENGADRSDASATNFSSPDPEEAIDVVNHIAVSFATTPVATPRVALHRVFWCYRFLCSYGAPVQPTITRALWHAGVARYGEQGTAVTQLKWILEKVSQTEGEGVARQLLWSKSLREQHRQELESLGKIDLDEHSMLLAETTEATSEEGHYHLDLRPAIMADLEVPRKICFVQTERDDAPFWYESPMRKIFWERAQTRVRARRKYKSGKVDEVEKEGGEFPGERKMAE